MVNRRKSIKAKILQGTFRKDRDGNRNEPKIEPAKTLERPTWFSEDEVEVWNYTLPILIDMNVVTRADLWITITHVCACARFKAAERAIDADGLVIQTPTGIKKNPAVTIADEAVKQIRQTCDALGLTPAARAALSVPPPTDLSDEEAKHAEAAKRLIKP